MSRPSTSMTEEEFYDPHPGRALRLGDVLQGLPSLCHKVATLTPDLGCDGYTIDIRHPTCSAVMSPCCSIQDGVICVAPLVHVQGSFLDNPYLEQDLTRLNRPMFAEQAVTPGKWAKLSNPEKAERSGQGLAYAFNSFFVYAPHRLLKPYVLKSNKGVEHTVRHYMVDVRGLYRIDCPAVQRDSLTASAPKVLQLSAPARDDLRGKLSNYFARVPEEDVPFLNR